MVTRGRSFSVQTLVAHSVLLLLVWTGFCPATEDANEVESIDHWIQQLGDPTYTAREEAERELMSVGLDALDAIRAAQRHANPEIAMRATQLNLRIQVGWVEDHYSAHVRQLLANFSERDEKTRRAIIRRLALPEFRDGGGLEALCRIARYDASEHVSKAAAATILGIAGPEAEWWQQRAAMIQKGIGNSERPAVEWLRAAVTTAKDPVTGLGQWEALVDRELQGPQKLEEPGESYVVTLLQYHAAWLIRLDRRDELNGIYQRIVEQAREESGSLVLLVHWAAKHGAWELVPLLAERFDGPFAANPLLRYVHAEAEFKAGDEARAEELGHQAFAAGANSHSIRVKTASHLQHLGLLRWVIPEWREVIRLGPPERFEVALASARLAPLLHDRQQDAEAADVLFELLEVLDENLDLRKKFGQDTRTSYLNPESLRANMYYYRALVAARLDQRQDERDYLEQAAEADPFDGDVLIAMYRCEIEDDEFQNRTRELIHDALEHYEALIAKHPEEPLHYNHYAWLTCNTEGDFDKATQYAQQALEYYVLSRGAPSAAILDTLAHCYFAQGEYAEAVTHQRRAVELEPHTGLIVRKLKVFEEALAAAERESATSRPTP